jgi:hypothetical protein
VVWDEDRVGPDRCDDEGLERDRPAPRLGCGPVAVGDAQLRGQAWVVKTIRPDTVFIAYHWPGQRSANRLTHRTIDPRSKIPEYKVSACRLAKAAAPPEWAGEAEVAGLVAGTGVSVSNRSPGGLPSLPARGAR